MNGRLQVGGLALVTNSIMGEIVGTTVSLVSVFGDIDFNGDVLKDCWEVEASEKVRVISTSGHESMSSTFHLPAAWLMPLGDQQTQDELRKEQEELTCKN
ncbi:MAG: hypothetical protein RR282_00565 [Acinetobacter sp.]